MGRIGTTQARAMTKAESFGVSSGAKMSVRMIHGRMEQNGLRTREISDKRRHNRFISRRLRRPQRLVASLRRYHWPVHAVSLKGKHHAGIRE